MKKEIITEILQKMLPYLNNQQLDQLKSTVDSVLTKHEITDDSESKTSEELISKFIEAKRIEGCSEKTLNYYRKTITDMLSGIEKETMQITTEDLRKYLTNYQESKKISKVTVDNVRRILSSFFSWLEDEDYILKSPVRRIHKVKTTSTVKETYTDEALEQMRDSCTDLRDLAMIDMLASTGMRVGEMVLLNRNDINFNERECVVLGKGNKQRIVYFDARTKIHLQNYLDRIHLFHCYAKNILIVEQMIMKHYL